MRRSETVNKVALNVSNSSEVRYIAGTQEKAPGSSAMAWQNVA